MGKIDTHSLKGVPEMVRPTVEMLQGVTLTGKTLGALFYYPPDSVTVENLYQFFTESLWTNEWSFGSTDELVPIAVLMKNGLTTPRSESLIEAYQRLFIGPHSLQAPPWGSVYLDRENVIFGDSTLELRQWQRGAGIDVQLVLREPEDHFGLMLMQAAWLAECSPERLAAFLQQHLLPWSSRYLVLLDEHARQPFYQGLARLAQLTLTEWQKCLALTPVEKRIYF